MLAEASVALSASLTVSAGSSAVGPSFSVKARLLRARPSTGGASLTTVIVTLPLACRAPPEPLLPRSLTVTSMPAAPAPVAVKTSVASAALRSAWLPRTTTVVSLLPVPPSRVRPVMVPKVTVPLPPATVLSVNCSAALPASRSERVIVLPLAVENASDVSCGVACAPGKVSTGASLTAVTVIPRLALAVLAPPLPLLPRSLTLKAIWSGPL